MLNSHAISVQAVVAQPITEKVVPGHDRSAEVKLYSLAPHAMDPHDTALTSLSSSIGKIRACSKSCVRLVPCYNLQ